MYFYPADDTPGCTKEACQFNDNLRAFDRAGVAVLGISADRAEKHQVPHQVQAQVPAAHRRRQEGDGEAYGAWGEKTMYGKKTVGVIRSTFLVGPDGKIARAWYTCGPTAMRPRSSSGGLSAGPGLARRDLMPRDAPGPGGLVLVAGHH